MPIEFVGGLFPRNQLAPRASYNKPIDLHYLRDLARAHEHAGFDRVLIANGGGDPLFLAAYAAAHTETLGFMLAHRPGLTAPTIAARAFATLDQTTGGRIRLHAITGHAAEPEHGEVLLDKDARYARADEYLEIVKRTWSAEEPFDFSGKYFTIKGGYSPIKPLQKPYVPISLGGSSDAAYHVAVRHTDLYALWAEPYHLIAERIHKLRTIAQQHQVATPRVSLSVRLIIGATEEQVWKKPIALPIRSNTIARQGQHRHAATVAVRSANWQLPNRVNATTRRCLWEPLQPLVAAPTPHHWWAHPTRLLNRCSIITI